MRILPSKTHISANSKTLVRIILPLECMYRGYGTPWTHHSAVQPLGDRCPDCVPVLLDHQGDGAGRDEIDIHGPVRPSTRVGDRAGLMGYA